MAGTGPMPIRVGSTPTANAVPQRRTTDVEAFAEPEMEIDDDSPTCENLALDADLDDRRVDRRFRIEQLLE